MVASPECCCLSGAQVQGQADQARVCRNTQCRQDHHSISTGSEFVTMDTIFSEFGEKLSISLRAAEQPNDEDSATVDSKERTNTVELGGEDLEHDEGEGELGEGRADVGTFKGPLSSADLDDFI